MTVIQKLKSAERPLISAEFFPPKSGAAQDFFRKGAVELTGLKPDFVSVTCGAGGSAAGPTLEISKQLRGLGYNLVVPHCTCVGVSRSELARSTDELVAQGFQNIMALRGDPPRGEKLFNPSLVDSVMPLNLFPFCASGTRNFVSVSPVIPKNILKAPV